MTKMAAIQMCSSEDVEENLQTARNLIQEAAQKGAKLIALPEMFPLVTYQEEKRLLLSEPFGRGRVQDFLAKTAKQCGIWLVGGTIPIQAGNSKNYAACLVYDNRGQ